MTARCRFGKETKGKVRLQITDPEGKVYEELVLKEKNILVHEGQVVNKGESIVDGRQTRRTSCACWAFEEAGAYIVDEVQDVYRLQGCEDHDKHIEVIVRQMLRRVQITNRATRPNRNEQVERSELWDTTTRCVPKARYCHACDVLLGITKASLSTDSFILGGVVQETTRVDRGGDHGKRDELRGLKENASSAA